MDPSLQTGDHRPGADLRRLAAEARYNGAALARAVNAIGTETGLSLHYGRASAAQWLSGTRPRPPVPGLLAEALARRLGRGITLADIGCGNPGPAAGWDTNPVAQLTTLADIDGPRRRGVPHTCVYSLGALAIPAWGRGGVLRVVGPDTDASVMRVGSDQVAAADTMLHLFAATDAAHGAAAIRPATAYYLAATIGPWLRASATSRVHSEMLSIGARLSYLCGFLCTDDELDGAAQRYYLIALRLAVEADDPVTYAIALRGLSVQAHALGHHTHSLALAEAAHAAGIGAPPVTRAFLDGQLALASAAIGDRRNAVAHLRAAEHHLNRAVDSTDAVGIHHLASFAHQKAGIRSCLGDRTGAITALQRSIRDRPAAERRSRAITLARLAELQLVSGRLDDAVASWHRFLDDYPAVDSVRVHRAFNGMRARLRPYAAESPATTLLHRAAGLYRITRRSG